MAQVIQLKPSEENESIRQANKIYLSGDYARAGAMAETYLMEHPDDAQALTILAACLKQGNRTAIAYTLARRAAELRPDRSETWCTQGHTAQNLWRMDEALSCYRKALQRAQTDNQRALYNNNLGSVYLDLGQFAKAEDFIRKSLEFDAKDPNARHNFGLCLLAKRDWSEAWKWYSASIGSSYRAEFRYGKEPRWDGQSVKTLVVYGEQGLGDEICAASAIPDVMRSQEESGGRLILDVDARLENLFRRSFPGAIVHGTRWEKKLSWPENERNIDASISAFEVLKFYRNKAEDFPGTPYLKACPTRTQMWRALHQGKPTIGIAWSGGTWKNAGSFRKLPIDQWKPLFESVDAHWVSLQYKDVSEEIKGTPVVQYHFATLTKDYDDTAALVASCDLVIAVQTSVNHLSGALGVPTLTLIPETSQWRYGEEYEDLPWYKSVSLIRADKGKPFAQIIEKVCRKLQQIPSIASGRK